MYTRWYAQRWGREYLNAEWCAIFIAWAADKAGVLKRVGADAYTPSWADWYARKGRWGRKPKRGAVVFYDWQGGKARWGIDHVGIVERIHPDGSITAIEGNASGKVRRTWRSPSVIVGYGYWMGD